MSEPFGYFGGASIVLDDKVQFSCQATVFSPAWAACKARAPATNSLARGGEWSGQRYDQTNFDDVLCKAGRSAGKGGRDPVRRRNSKRCSWYCFNFHFSSGVGCSNGGRLTFGAILSAASMCSNCTIEIRPYSMTSSAACNRLAGTVKSSAFNAVLRFRTISLLWSAPAPEGRRPKLPRKMQST